MADMPSQPVVARDHERHDPLLVARHAAGDELPADERDQAVALLAACPDCRELAADLPVIARAVAAEPVSARPRDFRITPEQAQRLRGSWSDRLLGRFAFPDLAILRPLAGSALALGLLLVAVGTVVPPGVTTVPEPAMFQAAPDAALMDDAASGKVTDDGDAPTLEAQPMLESQEDPSGAAGTVEGAPMDRELVPEVAADAEALPESAEIEAMAPPGETPGPDAAAFSVPDEEPMTQEAMDAGAEDALDPGAADAAVARTAAAHGGEDGRDVVVVLGVLLALAGGLLGALLLLARRREDHLLR
jgi:hypothetical protein